MISRNRTARRNYEILETIESGISLSGAEVKSVRARGMKLEDAYVKVVGGKPQLINANISQYAFSHEDQYDAKKTRPLLLHKKEIIRLQTKLAQSPQLTIVPLACYNKKGLIKLEIALAKGKKSWQIKRIEMAKTEKRRIEKELRSTS